MASSNKHIAQSDEAKGGFGGEFSKILYLINKELINDEVNNQLVPFLETDRGTLSNGCRNNTFRNARVNEELNIRKRSIQIFLSLGLK
jgi:hypothetical protein